MICFFFLKKISIEELEFNSVPKQTIKGAIILLQTDVVVNAALTKYFYFYFCIWGKGKRGELQWRSLPLRILRCKENITFGNASKQVGSGPFSNQVCSRIVTFIDLRSGLVFEEV